MYKSGFLKDKIVEQTEKRKRERKGGAKKGPDGEQMPEHSLFGGKAGAGGKKKGGAAGDEGYNEEAQEIIDELKNDLKIRDQEYEELKAAFTRLEAENRRLREVYGKERDERLVIEGKLKKTAIHHELKEASEAINTNTFFEQKRSKMASINTTLLSTVSFVPIVGNFFPLYIPCLI